MKKWALLCLILAGCNDVPKVLDVSLSAEDGQDVTAIFEGCDQKTQGYLFCRLNEGSSTDRNIVIHFPAVKCSRDNCVQIQFVDLQGSMGYGLGLKSGQTEANISLKSLLAADSVTSSHDGEYRVLVRMWFVGPDSLEHEARFSGALRLWIVSKQYLALVCNDPQQGWNKRIGHDCKGQYSTAGRTALCGACK